jgi:hypothetical protein
VLSVGIVHRWAKGRLSKQRFLVGGPCAAEEARPERVPKVLYIAGWGRSGSTLLDQILGQAEGWFSCGELNFVWHNFSCGCGSRVHDCAFWSSVLERVTRGHECTPEQLMELQRAHLGASPRKLLAIRRARGLDANRSPHRRYGDVLRDLYAEIGSATGARVIVDSSKLATDAYLLATLTDLDLHVVHLVRDPRATAYSWGRQKQKDPALRLELGRLGPAASSLYWLRRNAVIESLLRRRLGDRYLRLRYEDFVSDPRSVARDLCAFAGEPRARLPFLDDRRVRLTGNHMVGGNPRRFSSGETIVRADDEWRAAMGAGRRLLATLPALPLARRYGYSLIGG